MLPITPENRRKMVFRAVVREYIETAEPVGSEVVVSKYGIRVSPATIRNDMAYLEGRGLLEQPHTSAGRVPTEAGYRYYVKEFTREVEPNERGRRQLQGVTRVSGEDADLMMKNFARAMAELTGETVVVSLGGGHSCVAGLSNTLRQPEFRDADSLLAVSKLIDELESVITDLRRLAARDIEVLIGAENPLGPAMSSVVAGFDLPQSGSGLVGIFGPQRMDYEMNIALARELRNIMMDI
jgi:heat-inducible transcriptional repressor